jgi:hypothetical protein
VRLSEANPALVSSEACVAIERVVRGDSDQAVRVEALRLLCRRAKTWRDRVVSVLLSPDKVEAEARDGAAEVLAASASPGGAYPVKEELSRVVLDERVEVRESVYLAFLRRFGPPGLAFFQNGPSLPQDQAMGRAVATWTREQGIGLNVRGAPGLVIPESRALEEQEDQRALLDLLPKDEKPR